MLGVIHSKIKQAVTGISFAAFCLALSNTIVSSAHASNLASANASVTVDSTCTMNAAVTSEHSATMVNGTYSGTNYPNGIGSTTMQTFCNDANGYAIYAIGYTNNEEGNTVLKGGAGLSSDYDIVTGTATSGSGNNDVSNWAMKVSSVAGTYAPTIVNGFNDFSNIPSSYTTVAKYNGVTDQNTTGSSITTTYAAYISNTQPAGTYTGQVKYVLVHPDFDVSTARTMQNIAEWEDELLPGVQVTTVDSRDGSTYNVAKLKDGNIWMLDNLALGSDTAITLTNADTNMTATSWTLPASTTTGFTNEDASYTTAAINADSKTTTKPLAVGQSGTGKVGIYYNYCAASAGTYCMDSSSGSGNATSDICPKGWRLPTGGESGEFQALRNQYASNTEYVLALRTPLTGAFYDGSEHYQGGSGYFWSSTYYDAAVTYGLYVNTAGANPQFTSYRRNGFSVRCIRETLPTMQEVTADSLAEMMPNAGDTTKLRDSRDGTEYTIGKLADGNYWMLDNLALGSDVAMTLTNADTNMAAASWTLPASMTTGNEEMLAPYYTPSISSEYKDVSVDLAMGQTGTGKVGVYYNYCAASAGTHCPEMGDDDGEDAPFDICPKGWRLPTGDTSGEFQILRDQYSSDENFVAALRTPLSGSHNGYDPGDTARGQGDNGYFWASTNFDVGMNFMADLEVTTSSINPQNGDSRMFKLSVRCVKK